MGAAVDSQDYYAVSIGTVLLFHFVQLLFEKLVFYSWNDHVLRLPSAIACLCRLRQFEALYTRQLTESVGGRKECGPRSTLWITFLCDLKRKQH